METQSEEQAAAEAADSRGEGEPLQVAGAQAARPEDRMALLLRLFPLAGWAGTKWASWPGAPRFP